MFDCGKERETPLTLEEELDSAPKRVLEGVSTEDYSKYDLLCFQIVENKIRTLFEKINAEDMINYIATLSNEMYISLVDLNHIAKMFIAEEYKNQFMEYILLPFFVLSKNDDGINDAISYRNFINFNMKQIIAKELGQFKFEKFYTAEIDDDALANPKYNIDNLKQITKIDSIFVILFLLFFSSIRNEKKASILFDILDSDKNGILKTGKKKFYLVFRKMILIALFYADILLNQEISLTKKDFLRHIDNLLFNKKEQTTEGNSDNDYLIFSSYNNLTFEYKKILLFIKHCKGLMKNLVTFISHSFVFFEDITDPQIDKKKFLEICKNKKYSIFNTSFYRNYLVQYLFHTSKNTRQFLHNFPSVFNEIAKLINISIKNKTLNIQSVVTSICRKNNFFDYEELFIGSVQFFKNIIETNEYQTKHQIEELSKIKKSKAKSSAVRELDKDIVNIPGEKKEIEPGSFEEEKNQSEENSIQFTQKKEPETKEINSQEEEKVQIEDLSDIKENVSIENKNKKDLDGYGGDSEDDIIDNENLYESDLGKNYIHEEIIDTSKKIAKQFEEDKIPLKGRPNFDDSNQNASKKIISSSNEVDDELFKLNLPQSKNLNELEIGNIPKKSDDDAEESDNNNLKDVANQISELRQTNQISNRERMSFPSISPVIMTEAQFFKAKNEFLNDNFISSNNFESSTLQPTKFLAEFCSELDTFANFSIEDIERELDELPPALINRIIINKFTPFLASYTKKNLYSILSNEMSEAMMNLYFNIMTYYNIFLRNSDLTGIKTLFFDTNFFNMLQECHMENSFDKILTVYEEDLFIKEKFIFDFEEYIIVIPVFIDKKNLFLAVLSNRQKTITFLDSNDVLNDNPEIIKNYKILFETFFSFIDSRKICERKICEWEIEIDSIEAICYNENYVRHIMVFYSKMLSKNGKIRTVPENEYQSVKEIIFKELAMFYIKLGKFVKGNNIR